MFAPKRLSVLISPFFKFHQSSFFCKNAKKNILSTAHLELGIKQRKVSGLETEHVAQLPVEAEYRFESDGTAELVENLGRQRRVRRAPAGAVHRCCTFLQFLFFFTCVCVSLILHQRLQHRRGHPAIK